MNRAALGTLLLVGLVAAMPDAAQRAPAASIPDDPALVAHVVNRLTFGARPGDIDRVRSLGLTAWLDLQLHPERINDDAMAAQLRPLADPPASADPKELRRFARQQVTTLASNKILRAAVSERQLQEVLLDFWFNHFNVYAAKGRTAVFLPEYERDTIAPRVLGHFRDLLGATAKSPAMLFYLDNWLNAAAVDASAGGIRNPGSGIGKRPRRQARIAGAGSLAPKTPAAKRTRGPNENYARELLELHTLGVDGGYTQKDVVEVARAFTGWTIDRDRQFRFVPALHDRGPKSVLGHEITAGGVDEGDQVLDILARHPSTARHVAFELAQWLVADDPPATLVDRAAARFTQSDGDLREVVRTIVTSPEFLAPPVRDVKFKTPFMLVVSAMRAAGATVQDGRAVAQQLALLGEPLFMCQPPTGYGNTAEAWVSAGGLVTRMNFATRLSSGMVPGVSLPAGVTDAGGLARRLGSPAFQRY